MNPIKGDSSTTGEFTLQMYEPLFLAADRQLKSLIVDKWEMTPDGTAWVYTIHKGISSTTATISPPRTSSSSSSIHLKGKLLPRPRR